MEAFVKCGLIWSKICKKINPSLSDLAAISPGKMSLLCTSLDSLGDGGGGNNWS